MRSIPPAFLILAVLLSTPTRVTAQASRPAPDPAVGEQAYKDNCARCHGPTGAGDGRDAARIFPRPRPLSEGVFKFRTTASGTPPTDEDLFGTITGGLPGSRMPDFTRLPEETRWQLVEYVKGLSPAFTDQKPEPIPLGTDPGRPKANLQRGQELYKQLGCNACHGNLGRGDGPSAPTLVDQWNEPIQAADLTQGWSYRSGSEPKEILTRLMTGIDGTPMPSYAEAVSAAEVWDLAYYVHSLQVKPNWSRLVEAAPDAGKLPESEQDAQWEAIPWSDLRLSGNLYREGRVVPSRVNAISVKALYNDEEIAFLLAWQDRTESRESPPDAAALAFLPDPRQRESFGSLRNWSAGPDAPTLDLRMWSAEKEAREGASYTDGRWTVLLRRPLKAGAGGVNLSAGKRVPLGVMVWDGGNGEQGRHRSNSLWINLVLTSNAKETQE